MKNAMNWEYGKLDVGKKSNYLQSVIYKEVSSSGVEWRPKSKNNRQSKDTIVSRQKKVKDEQKSTIPSKKSSLNQFNKKGSKNDLSGIDFYDAYQKLNNNFMIETQQQTCFEPEDTKHFAYHKQKKDTNERLKKTPKQTRRPNNLATAMKINVGPALKMNAGPGLNVGQVTVGPSVGEGRMGPSVGQVTVGSSVGEGRVEKSLFNYMFIIGKGGFGKVWKCEHKKTKNQYAMKEMLKSIVMTKKSVQSVMNERVLLSQFSSPFVVNMHFAFQDRDTLYLVLDLMEGGDLRYHIGSRVFNEIQSKFFVACILLGLEDLHNNNIIHRDIKPQNLVLDGRGYIRITDLGIARIMKANNSCDTSGTPGYMSPEVICRLNHAFVSDFFAVGVIAYELMTGKRPYNGRSRNQIRDLMLAKNVQLKDTELPQGWTYEAADFVNRMIRRKPENRLGANGIGEVKSHPWLAGINWDKLKAKEIESPFIPIMKKCNFDQDEQITIEDEEEAELIQKNSLLLRRPEFQELFNGYYYSRQETVEDVHQLRLKERKNHSKQPISAYRKSQQERDPRPSENLPEKKLSYNEGYKKKDTHPNKNNPRHLDRSILDLGLRDKKKSTHYDKAFFR